MRVIAILSELTLTIFCENVARSFLIRSPLIRLGLLHTGESYLTIVTLSRILSSILVFHDLLILVHLLDSLCLLNLHVQHLLDQHIDLGMVGQLTKDIPTSLVLLDVLVPIFFVAFLFLLHLTDLFDFVVLNDQSSASLEAHVADHRFCSFTGPGVFEAHVAVSMSESMRVSFILNRFNFSILDKQVFECSLIPSGRDVLDV